MKTNQIKYLLLFFFFCLNIVFVYYVFFYIVKVNIRAKASCKNRSIKEPDIKNINIEQSSLFDSGDLDSGTDNIKNIEKSPTIDGRDLDEGIESDNMYNIGSSIQEIYFDLSSNKQNFCVYVAAKEVGIMVKEMLQGGTGNNILASSPGMEHIQSTLEDNSSQQNIVGGDFSYTDAKKINSIKEYEENRVVKDICTLDTQEEEHVSSDTYEKKAETYIFFSLSSIKKIFTSIFDSGLQAIFVFLSLLFVLSPANSVRDREISQKKKNRMKKKSSERNAKISETLFNKKDDIFPSDNFPKRISPSGYNSLSNSYSSLVRSPEPTRPIYPRHGHMDNMTQNINSQRNHLLDQLEEISSDEENLDDERKPYFQTKDTSFETNERFQSTSHGSIRQSIARQSVVLSVDGRPNTDISVSNFRAPTTLQSRTTSSIDEIYSLEEISPHLYFRFLFGDTMAECIRLIIDSFLEQWRNENLLNLPFDSHRDEFIDAIQESGQGLSLFFSYINSFGQALQGTEYQRLTEETHLMLEEQLSSGNSQIFDFFFKFIQTRTESMTIDESNSNLAQNIFQLFSAMVPRFFKIYESQERRLQTDNIDSQLSGEDISKVRSILMDLFFFFFHLDLLHKKNLAGTELKKIF